MRGYRGLCRRAVLLAVFPGILAIVRPGTAGGADWAVKTIPRPDGRGTQCVLESASRSLSDGYETTTVRIILDKTSVVIRSASSLDESFRDIGLVVDEREIVPMDRLAGEKTALFDSKYARLVEQFEKGARVRVQLRFWPEWPATGQYSVTFSLMGFTRAHSALSACP